MQDKFFVDLARLEEYTASLKKQLDRMQEAEAYLQKRTRALSGMLEDQVTVSPRAASMGGSQAFLDAGERYKLSELLKTVIVASANDSAVALAGRGEEMRRRTELLNRQEDNNRATAARLLGKE